MDFADERGAEAAARYFFELYAYVVVTGETSEWDAMSWQTCEFCASIRDDARGDATDGVTYAGGKVTIYDLSVGYDDLLDGYPVELSYAQAPATRTSREGVVVRLNGNSGRVQVDLKVVDSQWRVLHVAHAGSAS